MENARVDLPGSASVATMYLLPRRVGLPRLPYLLPVRRLNNTGDILTISETSIFKTIMNIESDEKQRQKHESLPLSFHDHTRHYRQRQFTVDADALSAFTGVLSMSGNRSHYGVPFFESRHDWNIPDIKGTDFMLGLLWRMEEENEARPMFPSWSWLSKKGASPRFDLLDVEVSYNRDHLGLTCVVSCWDIMNYHSQTKGFFPELWIEENEGAPVTIEEFLGNKDEATGTLEASRYLVLHTAVIDIEMLRRHVEWGYCRFHDGNKVFESHASERYDSGVFLSHYCS